MWESPLERACGLLAEDGLPPTDVLTPALEEYVALVRSFNPVLSLVSAGDAEQLMERHVVDSLSLARWVVAGCGMDGSLLDIGSGGGFPGIPLKLAVPGLSVTLLERSVKKIGFLRRVVGALGLTGVTVVWGEFPAAASGCSAGVVTARAVERPGRLLGGILDRVREGAVFLSQTGQVAGISEETFHVERLEDRWTELGVRRGRLYRVRVR